MEYNKAIDQFITYLLEPHEEKTYDKHPGSIFWVKGGDVIVKIKKSRYFWLDYEIWERISEMFGFEYKETQSVIKIWLEQHYGLGGLTPDIVQYYERLLEQHYGLGGLTPQIVCIYNPI